MDTEGSRKIGRQRRKKQCGIYGLAGNFKIKAYS
jgi:hypothetical protein